MERVSGRAIERTERIGARPVKVLGTGESSSSAARPVHQDRHDPPAAQACRLLLRDPEQARARRPSFGHIVVPDRHLNDKELQ